MGVEVGDNEEREDGMATTFWGWLYISLERQVKGKSHQNSSRKTWRSVGYNHSCFGA